MTITTEILLRWNSDIATKTEEILKACPEPTDDIDVKITDSTIEWLIKGVEVEIKSNDGKPISMSRYEKITEQFEDNPDLEYVALWSLDPQFDAPCEDKDKQLYQRFIALLTVKGEDAGEFPFHMNITQLSSDEEPSQQPQQNQQ